MTTDNARSRMSGERNMPLPDYPLHANLARMQIDVVSQQHGMPPMPMRAEP